MLELDDMGRSEGRDVGPRPGKGAVVHECSGEADFDGLPGDVLPPREAVKRKLKEDAPAPPVTIQTVFAGVAIKTWNRVGIALRWQPGRYKLAAHQRERQPQCRGDTRFHSVTLVRPVLQAHTGDYP